MLGAEGGAKLAAKYGCEAIFITEDKKVICTDGIKPNVTVLADGYTVVE